MPCTASMIIYAWGKHGQSTVPDWVRRTFRRFYVCQAAAVARQCLGGEGGAGVEGTGGVALEAQPDLTAGLGLALERVTRIELVRRIPDENVEFISRGGDPRRDRAAAGPVGLLRVDPAAQVQS